MNKKITIIILVLISLTLATFAIIFLVTNKNYHVQTDSHEITIDRSNWKAVKNPTDFAVNFMKRQKRDAEVFEQMVTIYMSPLEEQDILGSPRISENVWLELFTIHPNSVTAQMQMNKGNYWVNSRQTFSTERFIELESLNPESSPEAYQQYLISLEEEIKNTIFILSNKF